MTVTDNRREGLALTVDEARAHLRACLWRFLDTMVEQLRRDASGAEDMLDLLRQYGGPQTNDSVGNPTNARIRLTRVPLAGCAPTIGEARARCREVFGLLLDQPGVRAKLREIAKNERQSKRRGALLEAVRRVRPDVFTAEGA